MKTRVLVPKENVSDEAVVIVEWLVKKNQKVSKGQIIVTVESSKATFDIEATANGFIFYELAVGSQISVGDQIAEIGSKEIQNQKKNKVKSTLSENTKEEPNYYSKKALALINKYDLDVSKLNKEGLITEKDINELFFSEQLENKKSSILNINKEVDNVLLCGVGGMAKVCIEIINEQKLMNVAGIIDLEEKIGSELLGVPIVGRDEDLKEFVNHVPNIANSLGLMYNHSSRQMKYDFFKDLGFSFPNIIHPTAVISESAKIGHGNIILANSVISSFVKIKNNCIINSGSVISHDCLINDNVHIAPGANIAGHVSIGKNTLIGMGVSVYYRTSIGENVIINNGVSIIKSVPDNQVRRN